MLFFGVVSSQTETAFELFLERERAEEFIAEVEQDEPENGGVAQNRAGRARPDPQRERAGPAY